MEKKIKILLIVLGIVSSVSFFSLSDLLNFADADTDGIADSVDNCPLDHNPDQANFDSDSFGDLCDPDDDNDNVNDSIDMFDTDPLDWADFDFDGIGSNADDDDDNDGVLDSSDLTPILSAESLTNKYLKNIEFCDSTKDESLRLVCYSEFFGMLTEKEGNVSDALDLSITLSKIGTMDDCHFVSHQIGHAAFMKTQDVYSVLNGHDGTMCRGGYFHGVLASYFHNLKDTGEDISGSYDAICDGLIGSSNYQDCVHGLGHGVVHYFNDNLDSAIDYCHSMSFYQNILCMKGVMMQYTDDSLTRKGVSKSVISNLCDAHLQDSDYIECNMSTGTTIAFFTNHDYSKGEKLCKLIENEQAQNYCLEGLDLEIQDSEKYERQPLTEQVREKFQPQKVSGTSAIIDIRSPAKISNFEFTPNVGIISFTIDSPQYVILYIPNEFLSSKMLVTVNGEIPPEIDSQANLLDEEVSMIRFVPKTSGIVLITQIE